MPAVPFRFNANQISPASLVVPSESKLEPAVGAFPAFPTLG